MIGKARKTNILRPVYRLGWLAIWSVWLVVLLFGGMLLRMARNDHDCIALLYTL